MARKYCKKIFIEMSTVCKMWNATVGAPFRSQIVRLLFVKLYNHWSSYRHVVIRVCRVMCGFSGKKSSPRPYKCILLLLLFSCYARFVAELPVCGAWKLLLVFPLFWMRHIDGGFECIIWAFWISHEIVNRHSTCIFCAYEYHIEKCVHNWLVLPAWIDIEKNTH